MSDVIPSFKLRYKKENRRKSYCGPQGPGKYLAGVRVKGRYLEGE